MDSNVCNMKTVAEIQIHEENGKYYIHLIAWGDCANIIGVKKGRWSNSRSILKRKIENLLNSLADIKYY